MIIMRLIMNRIPDPYLDLNELAVQWVAEKDWIYKVHFAEPSEFQTDEPVVTELVFEGLDTFATVIFNGEKVLEADNMFLTYRIDVSSLIREENVLEITFSSALLRGRELVDEHRNEHEFHVRQTEMGRIPVRKAQYNWGWDWGPILMTAGPWRPVHVERYTVKLDDIWLETTLSPDLGICSGKMFARVRCAAHQDIEVNMSLAFDGTVAFEGVCNVNSSGIAEMKFTITAPRLWYPCGYGAQDRYEFKASIGAYDAMSKLIGFRRSELVQEEDDFGKSFYFRINGLDVFAGGSCWIPGDSFLSQMSRERYRDWIKLVAEGNQKMLRVWGGKFLRGD
jgi:beta-mannosidase